MNARILLLVEASIAFLLAFGIRLLELDRAFTGNELFHLMAGRSWIADGTFEVAYGSYGRNPVFTMAIGWLTQVFGEHPVVARMPAVLAGSLTVVALFAWVRAVGGRFAAWCAAILLCVSPLAIGMSQWVRVYALFGLTFFLGAVGIYTLVTNELRGRAALLTAILSAMLLAVSVNMRVFVILGIAGIVLWVAVEKLEWLRTVAREILRRRWVLVVTVVFMLVALGLALMTDELAQLLRAFRDLQPQAVEKQFDYLYYHRELTYLYPLLWGLTPVAAVLAIARRPSFGMFCSCIFFVVFIAYCFATRKWMRYLYFAMPFLFALWGFLLAHSYIWLKQIVDEMLNALKIDTRHVWLRQGLAIFIISMVTLFFVGTNSIVTPVMNHLNSPSGYREDWAGAQEVFSPWLEDTDAVILASPMQHPIFYYGRTDLEFGPKYVYEARPRNTELGVDRRTGLKAVSSRESMKLVFRCYGRGLLVMPKRRWRKEGYGPSDDVFALLEANASELQEARAFGLVAFAWDRSQGPRSGDCASLLPAGRDETGD